MYTAKTFEDFLKILKCYEIDTFSKFNVYQNPKGFLNEKCELSGNMKLHWEDGLPYFNFGTRIYTCHQGKDKNLSKKQKYAEKNLEKAKADHIFVPTHNLTQTTKKLDCPATIKVTRVCTLPQFKLENPTKSNKTRISERIRSRLRNKEDVEREEVFWFTLPSTDAHKNHMQGEISAITEPVDPAVRLKIKEFVHEGKSDSLVISELLEIFVITELKQNDKKRRRFFPDIPTIKRIIKNCKRDMRYGKKIDIDDTEKLLETYDKNDLFLHPFTDDTMTDIESGGEEENDEEDAFNRKWKSNDIDEASTSSNQDITDVKSFSTGQKENVKEFQCQSIIRKFNFLNKCLDCLLVYETRDELREHLQNHHDLDMSPVYLNFKKMEEFHTWKSNMERETLSTYQQKIYSKNKTEPSTIKYFCARSGRTYPSKNKKGSENYRMSRMRDTIKLGIACTAEIQAQLLENEVIIKHYPVHYGHGKDKLITKLSPEEQSAVDELTAKGYSTEKLLEELSLKESMDVFQMYPIRKRYLNWVRHAYKTEEYYTEMSDLECVSNWVKQCSNMEECPVLLCLQENIATESEEFILVIMTEFQKQIIISASKKVICVDVINRLYNVHLVTVLVIDELLTAFPVAYCLSNKLNKNVIKQFFTCIKEHAGNLSPEYLMTNHNLYLFESWVEVMNNSPQWLWSRWDTEITIRSQLRYVKKNPPKRRKLYNIFQTILECKSKDVTSHMFKSFIDKTQQDEKLKKLGERVMKRLGSDIEKWAMCYQKEVNTRTILHFEVMHHVLFTCGTLGKGKKLYTFLCVIMKVLRHKILDRILNSFDDEKIRLAVDTIDFCHATGLNFPSEKIFSLSNNAWMVQLDELNKVYVTQDMDKCPDHCSLRCKQCEICVHQFSCSCVNSMIDANLCLHIHAIVYKLLHRSKFQHTSSNKLLDLKANNSNNENHILDSTLLEPSVTNEIVQSEFSPSQITNSIIIKTATDEDISVQSAAYHSSQVLVSTPPQHYIPKLVSAKSRNDNLSTVLRTAKSRDHSVQKLTSILKRKKENKSLETTEEEMSMQKTTKVPQVDSESVNMCLEPYLKKFKLSQKAEEARNVALEKTTSLSQILKTQKLSTDSLTAINKCLNACISIADINKKKTVKTSCENPIKAVYVIKPQNKVLELVPSTKQSGIQTTSSLEEIFQFKIQKRHSNLTQNPLILTLSSGNS